MNFSILTREGEIKEVIGTDLKNTSMTQYEHEEPVYICKDKTVMGNPCTSWYPMREVKAIRDPDGNWFDWRE